MPRPTLTCSNALVTQDLSKNIDVDGDGEIDEEERKILKTLKSMDIDGDGNISLKELVNLGKQYNIADQEKRHYRKLVFFLAAIVFAAMVATFLLSFAAAEAAKDARTDKSGVMKTVTVTGRSKVVQTQQHLETVAIPDLYKATYGTLEGVKNMGFQVGSSYYAYTVTGFQQDLASDGTSAVRFYTSRGDTIFISAAKSILEKKSGGTIDISKAATLTRHLLQAPTYTDAGVADMIGNNGASATTTVEPDTWTTEQVAAIANASINATGNVTPSLPAGASALIAAACARVKYSHPIRTDDAFDCECNDGFTGTLSGEFNFTTGDYEVDGSCVMAPQPPETSCYMDEWFKEGEIPEETYSARVQCDCPWGTHKGQPSWSPENGTWAGTACAPREGVPKAIGNMDFVLNLTYSMTEKNLTYRYYEYKCPAAYSDGYAHWNEDWNMETGKPKGTGSWQSTPCKPKTPCPKHSERNETSGRCDCKDKFDGQGYSFGLNTTSMIEEWMGSCVPAACPPNANMEWEIFGDVNVPTCKCSKKPVEYVAKKPDGLWYDGSNSTERGWKGECQIKPNCSSASSGPMQLTLSA